MVLMPLCYPKRTIWRREAHCRLSRYVLEYVSLDLLWQDLKRINNAPSRNGSRRSSFMRQNGIAVGSLSGEIEKQCARGRFSGSLRRGVPRRPFAIDCLNADLAGCFRPGIMTFAKFADAVLEASPDPIRPLSGPMKRQLIRRLLDEQNDRGRFEALSADRPHQRAGRSGRRVHRRIEAVGNLARAFSRGLRSAGASSAKDEELLEIYESYQQALREHQLFDAEGSFWSARNWLQQGQRRPFENLQFVVVDGFSDFTRTQHEILEILGRAGSNRCRSRSRWSRNRAAKICSPSRLKTLAELQRRHPGLEVRRGARGEGRVESGECEG